MKFLSKLKFIFKRPKVIIVTGKGREYSKEAIFQVLKPYFKIGEEILIFETDFEKRGELEWFIKNSSLPILVVTHIGEIPSDQDFFAGERKNSIEIRKLAKLIPAFGHLVLNFDDETVREMVDEAKLKTVTFGFQETAHFRATDVKLNGGTNFKLNYKGNVVPIWLEKLFGKEQIYSALSAVAVGTIFDLNLVEISQALKNYHPNGC